MLLRESNLPVCRCCLSWLLADLCWLWQELLFERNFRTSASHAVISLLLYHCQTKPSPFFAKLEHYLVSLRVATFAVDEVS